MIANNNIKICRQKLDLTQKKLGMILNVAESTVSGWENGYDDIPLEKLIVFCNIYNYNIDFVVGLNNNINQTHKYFINQKKIGENLKIVRKHLHYSQQKVANILQISQSCYSQYENGVSLPTVTFLYSYSKVFNISIENILK